MGSLTVRGIPDDLLVAAKGRAHERGERLSDLITRALGRLRRGPVAAPAVRRLWRTRPCESDDAGTTVRGGTPRRRRPVGAGQATGPIKTGVGNRRGLEFEIDPERGGAECPADGAAVSISSPASPIPTSTPSSGGSPCGASSPR